MPSSDSLTDVAIVGAGPYGLSLASHLGELGVAHRIFGSPMQTWRSMLPGTFLKSLDFATSISTPRGGHSFTAYCRSHHRDSREPCPIALFTEYGLWAQEHLVPELEQCSVSTVGLDDHGFALLLDTGERLLARRVVMATGLAHARRMPRVLGGLPAELVTHTSEHSDLSLFRGTDVTVIGAGQSALEVAALLDENGATVRLLTRGGGAFFASPPVTPRPLRHRVMYPMSVLGPGRLNLFLERVPSGLHLLMSERRRVELTRRHLGPWGAWWMRDRVEGKVPVHPRSEVMSAAPTGAGLRLRIRQLGGRPDWEIDTGHVICGTGYEVDLDRTPILEPALTARIHRVDRAPRLDRHFQSSVPGLHFVGPASAFSFGPLFRFVAGAAYAAPVVARRLAGTTGSVHVSYTPAIGARKALTAVASGRSQESPTASTFQ